MTFDHARGVAVLFGGSVINTNTALGDTWEWDGTTWTERTPAISPPPRLEHRLTYDPVRQRVVMFGGRSASYAAFDDTWEWDGTAWTRVTPVVSPPPRYRGSLHFDPRRRRVVLAGGSSALGTLADVWEWDGATWLDRDPLVSLRRAHLASFIDTRGDMYVLAPEQWRLRWESATAPEDCARATNDSDGDALAGCDDPDCRGLCAPSCMFASCDPQAPRCGDGTCNGWLENYLLCPQDCP
jgi:hypothetical protein